jgi:predicted HTH transcriptional regulator
LNVPTEKELILPPQTDEEKVLAYVQKQGSISRLQCRILLNISDIQAKYFLQKMHRAKKLRLMGRGRGAKYVLP